MFCAAKAGFQLDNESSEGLLLNHVCIPALISIPRPSRRGKNSLPGTGLRAGLHLRLGRRGGGGGGGQLIWKWEGALPAEGKRFSPKEGQRPTRTTPQIFPPFWGACKKGLRVWRKPRGMAGVAARFANPVFELASDKRGGPAASCTISARNGLGCLVGGACESYILCNPKRVENGRDCREDVQ